MTPPEAQLPESQRDIIIRIIEEYLNKISTFSKVCDQEAQRSSLTKRKARWINGVGGSLIALMGIMISATNDETVRKFMGLASTAVGSIIATAGQFIDQGRARQRAIDLKNLGLRLEDLETESKVTYVGLRATEPDVEQLIALNKRLLNDFATLRREAYDLGVEV